MIIRTSYWFWLAIGSLFLSSTVYGQASEEVSLYNDEPLKQQWAPGKWGAADRIGALNRMTPERVLSAVDLVKLGKVATLGKIYSSDMPLYGDREWKFEITNFPPSQAWGANRGVALDDHLQASIGQVGTQFDGPGHIGVQTSKGYYFYNGRFLSEKGISEEGLGPLGVEHIGEKGFVCRGVLLNAAALRNGRLPVPQEANIDDPGIVSPEDIDNMVARQGIDPIGEGDCVFLHTGHGDLWADEQWDQLSEAEKRKRTDAFNEGTPGFGISACEYLAEKKVILTGADTWMVEATRSDGTGERGSHIECHVELQTKRGIWNIENLDFSQLVKDEIYEFLFVWSPLKIKGGTGSPGNPVAIY